MDKNLNQNLYSRFGLQLNFEEVQNGFRAHVKNAMLERLSPVIYPSGYKEPQDLYKAQGQILREACRQFFIDYTDYDSNSEYGLKWFVQKEFCDEFQGSFDEYLLRLQIFCDIVFSYSIIRHEFDQFIAEIDKYLNDFPILTHRIKVYKTKSPQILPLASKRLDKEIMDTLGVLDAEQFKSVLDDFEAGLKIFANAKTDSQLKDVVEDMHASCDEIVKIVLNNKNKSFKHATDKVDHKKLGLSGHQKEIFKNLKNLMDEIKHGSKKKIGRGEVEMIISMSAAFIRFVAIKHVS